MDLQQRVDALEDEVERLRQRCDELETIAFGDWAPPVEWGLKATEARLMSILMRRDGFIPKTILVAAMSYRREMASLNENNLESHISKMRSKLLRYGVEILSERFAGYRLPSATRARLRARDHRGAA